jgi:hypothetical protein
VTIVQRKSRKANFHNGHESSEVCKLNRLHVVLSVFILKMLLFKLWNNAEARNLSCQS